MKERPSSGKPTLDETKRLMGALVRMKPKPHEEMKLGKCKTRGVAKRKGLQQPKD